MEEFRHAVLQRMNDIADYLNWMEATQFMRKSEDFEQVLSVVEESEYPLPKREDQISRYLDTIEKELR